MTHVADLFALIDELTDFGDAFMQMVVDADDPMAMVDHDGVAMDGEGFGEDDFSGV